MPICSCELAVPLLPRSDRPHLALALLWAALVKAFVIAQTVCIARDGVDYIQFAFYLQREPWPVVWRESAHHPLYPLAILLVHKAFFAGRPLEPQTWQWSAQWVNFVASILATPAIYILARRLVSRDIALAVTILFHTLPGLTRCFCDALSEPLYLTGLCWCLTFATHGWFAKKLRYFLGAGIACALAYWTRPESAILALTIVVTLISSAIVLARGVSIRWYIRASVIFVLAFALVIAPYCYVIGGVSVKTSAQQILRSLSLHAPSSEHYCSLSCIAWNPSLTHAVNTAPILLLLDKLAQGFFYAPLILVIPGLLLAIRRAKKRTPWAFLLVYMALHLAVLYRGLLVLGYVTERYTYPVTICGLICAGLAWQHGKVFLGKLLAPRQDCAVYCPKAWPKFGLILFALFLVVCVAKLVAQPLHQGAAGHREIGNWLRKHMKAGDNLFDPYGLAAFYSGRLLLWAHQYPEGVGELQGDWWIVLNCRELDPRVRERIVAFSAIAEEAHPVFASAPNRATQVVLYHLPGPVHKLSPLRGRYFPRVR